MQLTCTVKKLFHLKREIADAKHYILTLEAKAPGVSALGPKSLESPFDADVKVWYMPTLRSRVFALFLTYRLF